MNYNIVGKIIKIDDIMTFGSGFQKRQFVIETDDKYPQKVPLTMIKDWVTKLDDVNVGDVVSVDFSVRGNEYKEKYYVDLTAWKISVEGSLPVEEPKQEAQDDDDIPF